ncbi:zinc-binding alcohol dehydrogenase family protein [Christiangramia sp. OXR-203]|uniref:zinc-binding alcohol dehydrogenase family protein n=1 Tax=Christiangramia sp. OXR-203 TaxID=3100176 RepID=UPI002AC94ACE|nr:zinc-binding alcohol dehydrogenase family protein [Christiangramia sp. OXR-203]WPY97167.1 zinc-binding alcohol dehydrogenase family protein [Christiangramia sp. OXR-203]
MKAIGFTRSLPISNISSLNEYESDKPSCSSNELLVKIKAISINPVDYKVRKNSAENEELNEPKIIGWDAAGVVENVGSNVENFSVGDEVYYAGDITKPGCYAEYQCIDDAIVAKKPAKLNWMESAALPLTALTAWECIFDRMNIAEGEGKDEKVLIIGGAGGVGSIAIQILKELTQFEVIATASREDTVEWCKKMGADRVVNHHKLLEELDKETDSISYILNFADTSGHWEAMTKLIAPQGHIACIVNTSENVDLNVLKEKSISFHWELMFTRSMFDTKDKSKQHEILTRVSELADTGKIISTKNREFHGLNAEVFREVHKLQESGKSIGKNVIEF